MKDWIGDEASDQEISDVLDAVADFVPLSMLKIQANSPLQFGEKVYDRADEIMENNPELLQYIKEKLPDVEGKYLPHEELKKMSAKCRFAIRTGEFTPYPNIILTAGVAF